MPSHMIVLKSTRIIVSLIMTLCGYLVIHATTKPRRASFQILPGNMCKGYDIVLPDNNDVWTLSLVIIFIFILLL